MNSIVNIFLDSKSYVPTNWPDEFKKEYLPLIERFNYNKGSLMQNNIETALSNFSSDIFALPPVEELSFMTWECDILKPYFNTMYEADSYNILMLHQVIGARKTNILAYT